MNVYKRRIILNLLVVSVIITCRNMSCLGIRISTTETFQQNTRLLQELTQQRTTTYIINPPYRVLHPRCPAFCDKTGIRRQSILCRDHLHCCKTKDKDLQCCSNPLEAITFDITTWFNCNNFQEGLKTTEHKHSEINTNTELYMEQRTEASMFQYCPSHCDNEGNNHKPMNCITPPYCCKNPDNKLICCSNASRAIGSEITDGFNCIQVPVSEYWQLVLAVCVPLATLSLIAFLVMTSYLMFKKRRARQGQQQQRRSSDSDISCSSWSMSSVSPANTLRGTTLSTEHTRSHRHRSHQHTTLSNMDIFVLSSINPPPYVDKPPPYAAVCEDVNTDLTFYSQANNCYQGDETDSLPDYESVNRSPNVFITSSFNTRDNANLHAHCPNINQDSPGTDSVVFLPLRIMESHSNEGVISELDNNGINDVSENSINSPPNACTQLQGINGTDNHYSDANVNFEDTHDINSDSCADNPDDCDFNQSEHHDDTV